MGGEASQIQGENAQQPTVRSQASYFGSTDFGSAENGSIENTIRDLHLQRLYHRAPHLRPRAPEQNPQQKEVHIQTVISITDPEPYIRCVSGRAYLLSFGFKSETPCKFVMIGNNLLNRFDWEVTDERTQISVPIPALGDFILEITPDLSQKEVMKGFKIITKHTLSFKYLGDDDQFEYIDQKMTVDSKTVTVTAKRKLPVINEQHQGKCLVCMQNSSTDAVGSCGHQIMCEKCKSERRVMLHHCPVCDHQ